MFSRRLHIFAIPIAACIATSSYAAPAAQVEFAMGDPVAITAAARERVLHKGDTVSLTVSKGPQLVQVPGDLRAMGVDAATSLLEGLGFKVKTEQADYYLGLGYVAGSDPRPGSMAPQGSTILLKII